MFQWTKDPACDNTSCLGTLFFPDFLLLNWSSDVFFILFFQSFCSHEWNMVVDPLREISVSYCLSYEPLILFSKVSLSPSYLACFIPSCIVNNYMIDIVVILLRQLRRLFSLSIKFKAFYLHIFCLRFRSNQWRKFVVHSTK